VERAGSQSQIETNSQGCNQEEGRCLPEEEDQNQDGIEMIL